MAKPMPRHATQRPTLFARKRYARYACGCAYATYEEDTSIMCPVHTTAGLFMHNFLVNDRNATQNSIPGVVANRYFATTPAVVENQDFNSIYSKVTILDPGGHEWDQLDEGIKDTGLCPACFIDHDDIRPCRISACECGNYNCEYRWCGSLQGLHALWHIHCQGKSEEIISIDDKDIFSYGPASDFNEAKEVLLSERARLEEIGTKLLPVLLDHSQRHRGNPSNTRDPFDSEYLSKSLERYLDPKKMRTAGLSSLNNLKSRLIRFYVAGFFPEMDSA